MSTSACYDFSGRIQNTTPFANCVASNAPPVASCDCQGGAVIDDLRVNGDVGTVFYAPNNEISLLGRGGIRNTALTVNDMDNCDYRNYTPYVVGPTGGQGNDPSEYSSIQAAIDAAVLAGATSNNKQFVFIKPGIYQENLTLTAAVDLYADSGSVLVRGNHVWNPAAVGEAFFATRITFIQAGGAPLLTVTTLGFAPPIDIARVNLVFLQCQLVQTDANNDGILCNIVGISDRISVSFVTTGLNGQRNTGTGSMLRTVGNGILELNSQTSFIGDSRFRIESTGGTGTSIFIYRGNSLFFQSSSLSSFMMECIEPATNGIFLGCRLNNNSIPAPAIGNGILNVDAGIWSFQGCYMENISTLQANYNGVGVNPTEVWAIGNFIGDNELLPLFVLNNGSILYAQNNIFDHQAPNWVVTTGGGGFYVQQQPNGTNTFRSGSNTVGAGIVVNPAITF